MLFEDGQEGKDQPPESSDKKSMPERFSKHKDSPVLRASLRVQIEKTSREKTM